MGSRPSLFTPNVDRHLLTDEGEIVVDEVSKHPICMIGPVALVLLGTSMMVFSSIVGRWWWIPVVLGLVICWVGLWKYHMLFMDRFVITNMRVFRVHGIFERHVATMPLARILDISVKQTFIGMIFNYGHFVFESAAEAQGLREIRYVADPNRRDLTIQGVIQRAGVRAAASAKDYSDGL